MIRLLLISLCLNSCLSLYSQNSEIDSLETVLSGLSSPTERVPLLAEISILTPSRFSEKKYKYAHEALQLSKAIGNSNHTMHSYQAIAFAIFAQNNSAELAFVYNDSLKALAQQQGDKLFIAKSLSQRARFVYQKDRTRESRQKAIVLYDEAFDIYNSIPDEKGLALCLTQKSYHNRRLGQLDLAIELAQEAHGIAKRINDPKSIIGSSTQLWNCLHRTGKYKEALQFTNEGLEIASKHKLNAREASIRNLISVTLNRTAEYDLSIEHLNKAIEINETLKDTNALGGNLTNLGVAYSRKGSYDKSLEAYFDAVNYLESQGNISSASNAYTNIGKNYKQLKEYDKAMEFYERSLKIKLDNDNEEGAGRVHNNMGTTCFELGEYDRALEHYFKALELHEKTKFKNSIGIALVNIGEAYMVKKSFAQALDYSYRSLDLFSEIGNKSGMGSSLQNIASTYIEMKKYPEQTSSFKLKNKSTFEIERILIQAKNLAEETGRFYELRNIYITLVEFYRGKDADNALLYQDKLMAIQDSIYQSDKLTAVAEMQTKFDLSNKIKENLHLKETNDLIRSRNQWYLITALGLFGFLIAGSFVYKQLNSVKQKLEVQNNTIEDQNDQLTNLNQTKDRFFGIIAHDLKSPLIAMQGLGKRINFLLQKNDQEQLLTLGDQVDSTSTKLNDLLDNLLNWASLQTGDIPYHPQRLNLFEIGEDSISLFENNAATKDVNLDLDIPQHLQVYADERGINTILRNLISNAVKFTPKGGTVQLKAVAENNQVRLTIKDSGAGIDPERLKNLFTLDKKSTMGTAGEKGTGLGLILCKELIELNKGTLKVTSKPGAGSCFEFTLPIQTTPKVVLK